MLNVFHWRHVALQYVGNLLRTKSDRAAHELRNVVALHELAVIVGVGTRQFEGLCATAVAVEVGNERTRVDTVGASAGEDDPASAVRPGVIALNIVGVDFAEGAQDGSLL